MSVFAKERQTYLQHQFVTIVLFAANLAASAHFFQKGSYLGSIFSMLPVTGIPIVLGMPDRLIYAVGLISASVIVALGFVYPWQSGSKYVPYIVAFGGCYWAYKYSSVLRPSSHRHPGR